MAESLILQIPQVAENQNNKYVTINTQVNLLEASTNDILTNAAVGAGPWTLTDAQCTQFMVYKASGASAPFNVVFDGVIGVGGVNAKRVFVFHNADPTHAATVKSSAAGTTVVVPPGGRAHIYQNFHDMIVLARGADTVPYDIGVFLAGLPANGATVWMFKAVRAFTLAGNFAGSQYNNGSNPTATAVFNVNRNGVGIGTISVSTAGVATFATTGGAAMSIAVGDVLALIAPSPQDATLSNVAITFSGSRSS